MATVMMPAKILGTIIAPSDPRTWDRRDPYKWLYFEKIKDLVVTGGGTINGMGQQWWASSCKRNASNTAAVQVYDIAYIGIKGTSATENAVKFACRDTFPCENLFLEDVQLSLDSGENSTACCWEALGSDSGLVYPPVFSVQS